jgi:hypothetical protein
MLSKTLFKLLAVYLVLSMVLITFPAPGWAMFLQGSGDNAIRKADVATIQKTLESTVVKQRLMDYGLSSEEAMARVSNLSDEQVHQFAAQLNSLQAGADGADAVIFVLLVVILVIVILELTGHHVILR